MKSNPLQPTELLHYLPEYRVLICKQCQYAMQPSAISRHLKVLHQIYRSHRKEFIKYTQTLDLAEPVDIILPGPDQAPVPFLPTENGRACIAPGCDHLCVTVKRMKNHWTTVHHEMAREDSSQPVTLQTFFRGNQLRYFVVSPPLSKQEVVSLDTHPLVSTIKPLDPHDVNWDDIDAFLMAHFLRSTCLTLSYNSETQNLWQATIPALSYGHPFLKNAILACSALHLASLNPTERGPYDPGAALDPTDRGPYVSGAACLHKNALSEFHAAIAIANKHNCHALLAFAQLHLINCTAIETQYESSITDWLHQVRNSYILLKPFWPFLEKGPLAALIPEGIDGDNITPLRHDPQHTKRLDPLIKIPFFGENSIAEQISQGHLSPFPGALLEITRAFQKSKVAQSNSVFTLWTAVSIWPARLSPRYLEALEGGDLPCLVILAHYFILLGLLDSHWYMKGFKRRTVYRIYDQLDELWRQWLEWPLEEIGFRKEDQDPYLFGSQGSSQ